MIKIKVCGLTRIEDIDFVNEYLPEYIGFVFADSKRKVDDNTAAILKAELDDRIRAVGVFVNEPIEHIVKLCQSKTIDIIQLHGDEDFNYMNQLKREIANPIIKAVRVKSMEQIEKMQSAPCDYLLLDTAVQNQYGGSGLSFDRNLIPLKCRLYFLAGGLNPENVTAALIESSPYCVDVSSGVETNGIKDKEKIKQFIHNVRSTFADFRN